MRQHLAIQSSDLLFNKSSLMDDKTAKHMHISKLNFKYCYVLDKQYILWQHRQSTCNKLGLKESHHMNDHRCGNFRAVAARVEVCVYHCTEKGDQPYPHDGQYGHLICHSISHLACH